MERRKLVGIGTVLVAGLALATAAGAANLALLDRGGQEAKLGNLNGADVARTVASDSSTVRPTAVTTSPETSVAGSPTAGTEPVEPAATVPVASSVPDEASTPPVVEPTTTPPTSSANHIVSHPPTTSTTVSTTTERRDHTTTTCVLDADQHCRDD